MPPCLAGGGSSNFVSPPGHFIFLSLLGKERCVCVVKISLVSLSLSPVLAACKKVVRHALRRRPYANNAKF